MVATSQDTKTEAWPIKTDNINAHLVKAEYAGTLRPSRTAHAFARTATLAVVIPASTVTFCANKSLQLARTPTQYRDPPGMSEVSLEPGCCS